MACCGRGRGRARIVAPHDNRHARGIAVSNAHFVEKVEPIIREIDGPEVRESRGLHDIHGTVGFAYQEASDMAKQHPKPASAEPDDSVPSGLPDLSALGAQTAPVRQTLADILGGDFQHNSITGMAHEQRSDRASHLAVSDLPIRLDDDADNTRAEPKTRQPQSHPRATSRKAMRQRKSGG